MSVEYLAVFVKIIDANQQFLTHQYITCKNTNIFYRSNHCNVYTIIIKVCCCLSKVFMTILKIQIKCMQLPLPSVPWEGHVYVSFPLRVFIPHGLLNPGKVATMSVNSK